MTTTRFESTSIVPKPLAINCVVVPDYQSRVLFVRLRDNEVGPPKIAWRRGWDALRQVEESGYRASGDVPDLWASTKTRANVAHGATADGFQLKFHFAPAADSAWSGLIGKPRLAAIVTVDVSTGYFLRVLFLHL